MRKCFLLAKSNISRAKGQTIAIVVLVLIAAMLLNIWLMLSLDYTQNFDRKSAEMSSEDVVFAYKTSKDDFVSHLESIIKQDSRTSSYSLQDCLVISATSKYAGGKIATNYMALSFEDALSRELGKYEIVEVDENVAGEKVYLPYLFKTGGGYKIGDTFDISFTNKTYTMNIAGFYENMMLGSFNASLCSLLFDTETYKTIQQNHGEETGAVVASVKLHNRDDGEKFNGTVIEEVAKSYPTISCISNYYSITMQARTLTASIFSAIISGIAFLILLIAVIVLASNVANYILENMKNLGALKAVGYTSKQLILSLLFQFICIGLFSTLVGIGLSYVVYPIIGSLLITQTGISYAIKFLAVPMLITVAVILLVIATTIFVSSKKVKKITPIVALRQGIETHNFKKNHVPLEKTKAPLNLAISLKTMFSNSRQSITMGITAVALSLLIVFSCVMLQNFTIDSTTSLGLFAGEQGSINAVISVSAEKNDTFTSDMASDTDVTKSNLYHLSKVNHEDTAVMCNIIEAGADLNYTQICYDGRLPKFDNEVAVGGKYAKVHKLKIGDTITLKKSDKSFEYLVSGFTQSTSFMGEDFTVTLDGYEKIGTLDSYTYYVNLRDGVSTNDFISRITETYGKDILATANTEEIIEGSMGVYISLVEIIVVAIIILTLIIVLFVLYLMVKTLLLKKKKDYGVFKAVGFTTWQLVLQTALSFMPSIIFCVILGTFIGGLFINQLLTLFFSGIGIMKCAFTIPIPLLIIAGIGVILFAFVFACLLSLKVRKITPKSLLTGE